MARWLFGSLALLAAGLWLGAATNAQEKQRAQADQNFVTVAAASGMAEVQLGQLAQQRATNPEVQKFGQHMVTDHTKANQQLMQIAKTQGYALPQQLDAKHQQAMQTLSRLSGANFDKQFMQQMVKDHEEAVALFQKESKDGQDANLRQFAGQTLPTLQKHLEMARTIAGQSK
jgi:putative membrane protein